MTKKAATFLTVVLPGHFANTCKVDDIRAWRTYAANRGYAPGAIVNVGTASSRENE
jgi:hypothetical protein